MLIKAEILVSRGAAAEGLALCEGALELLPANADRQQALPTLITAAWIMLLAGEEQRARDLMHAVRPAFEHSRHRAPGITAVVPVTAVRVGLAGDWHRFVERNAPIKRQRAALLVLEGRTVEAADLWAELSPYDEAVARVQAARELVAAGRRSEADVQLQRGLAFFRAVGATGVIRQAEALLAAAS